MRLAAHGGHAERLAGSSGHLRTAARALADVGLPLAQKPAIDERSVKTWPASDVARKVSPAAGAVRPSRCAPNWSIAVLVFIVVSASGVGDAPCERVGPARG